MTTRVTLFPANLPEACNGCWSATLELIKVLTAELCLCSDLHFSPQVFSSRDFASHLGI